MFSESLFNRQLRKARRAVKGTNGHERLLAICNHFEKEGHPHVDFTYKQIMGERQYFGSDRNFAAYMMREMANLVCINIENNDA